MTGTRRAPPRLCAAQLCAFAKHQKKENTNQQSPLAFARSYPPSIRLHNKEEPRRSLSRHLASPAMTETDSRLARSLLPEPTLSFTLPSLHDGLAINCRVYHPRFYHHQSLESPSLPAWKKHAAIFAHPYAPLGGSYDDFVVEIAASTLLRLGFVVGTFNFRLDHTSS